MFGNASRVAAAVFAVSFSFAVAGAFAAESTAPKTTMENLQAAYDGESNAHAKYLAYAKKADEEGFGKVASLFRAAAKSEEIHAKNHAEVIKKMNGVPKANVKAAEVKSTKENLEDAIKGETYEKDTMYPGFLKLAREEQHKDAVRTFNFAKNVEAEHAKLYAEALKNLDQWKGGKKDFFVCPECGNTVVKVDFQKCPICYNSGSKFEKVS
jgi:rubrerythrin